MERRSVAIVGSGPAGASTALHLLQRDPALARDCVIIEKARHPRPKICAGGLIPRAATCLKDLGIEVSVPHVTVNRAWVKSPTRTVRHEEAGLCQVIRRDEFDESLVGVCRQRGIDVHEEETVVELRREGGAVRVITSRGDYLCPLAVGADGSGSIVRRQLVGPGRERIGHAVMCDIPADEIEWTGFEEHRYDFDFSNVARGWRGYFWTFPCIVGARPHVNLGVYSMDRVGSKLTDALANHLGNRGRVVQRHVFPIRWYGPKSQLAAPNALLAGDAAGVDPLMGEGISLALDYGQMAAAAVCESFASGDFSGASYQRAVERSWLGRKLRRLYLASRLFYGPTWRFWFAIAERSSRLRSVGLRWYNGVDDWDHRSGWALLGALLHDRA
jgi:flavin-dependent dehydrogenase